MPIKAKAKKAVKKAVKKTAKKPVKKIAKPKSPALTCGVCGYRVIVDETCGCVEEHVLLCCGEPMTQS